MRTSNKVDKKTLKFHIRGQGGHALANFRFRLKEALLYIDTIGRWQVVDETACLTWEHDLTEGTQWFYPLRAYG